MTPKLILIVVVSAVALAFPLAIFINYATRRWKFEKLIRHLELGKRRPKQQGEAYKSKAPTLHEIVERELGTTKGAKPNGVVATPGGRHTPAPPGQPNTAPNCELCDRGVGWYQDVWHGVNATHDQSRAGRISSLSPPDLGEPRKSTPNVSTIRRKPKAKKDAA